jgi:dihydrofolate reductase
LTKRFRTAGGDELSEKDIEALASEAERGYDLTKAERVTLGRPSLGPGGVSPRVHVRVDAELAKALKARAKVEHRSVWPARRCSPAAVDRQPDRTRSGRQTLLGPDTGGTGDRKRQHPPASRRPRLVMRKLTYSMGVSLDGFIAGPSGEIDWSAPDEELHRFHNEQMREVGAHICGRRLYEVMTYWDSVDERSPVAEHELEFARIWKGMPKIVFSETLERVEGNARLVRNGVAEEVSKLKEQPGKDLAVGGAGLASTLTKLGLIDEYRLFVSPVLLGGGTPYFPTLHERIDLELVETQTFASRVVYLRYRRA